MSETVTLGEFLREKALNMRRWLRDELKEPTLLSAMDHMVLPNYVELGELLCKHKRVVKFQELHSLQRECAGTPLFDVIRRVRDREDLHVKFWRYMDLFVTCLETAQ